MLKNFGFKTIVDIDPPYYIRGKYLPDILAFKESGVWHVSKFWIDIKAVTKKQKFMLVRASSLRGGQRERPRPYDAYVKVKSFCREKTSEDS